MLSRHFSGISLNKSSIKKEDQINQQNKSEGNGPRICNLLSCYIWYWETVNCIIKGDEIVSDSHIQIQLPALW